MQITFDAGANQSKRIDPDKIETYVDFRTLLPKPSREDAHLRHILRFYIARALIKSGKQNVFVLPEILVGEEHLTVDVFAEEDDGYTLAICEPESVTEETEAILETLKDVEGVETVIVHSQYGKPGNVPEQFAEQLANKKFRLMAVVPPPFDDVYEYDIWMFETTFRDLFVEE